VFNVTVPELEAPTRRSPAVALARQTAMYLAHVCAGLSLRTVGQLFSRDRTTVAHGCATVEDRRDDARFDQAVTWMEFALHAAMLTARPLSREDA
jgi:chromosomal replication initiation ATPase DnaA